MFYGTVGVLVGAVLQFVGLFQKGDDRLMAALLKPVFHGQMPGELSFPLLSLVTAVFCYGVAFVVLDTAGAWKRVVLGITVLVLLLAMVPTFAVWSIYFSPFLPVVSVFWAWFFCMMYVNHHVMPCEVLAHNRYGPNPQLDAPSSTEEKVDDRVEKVEPVVDATQKYKPKEKVDG